MKERRVRERDVCKSEKEYRGRQEKVYSGDTRKTVRERLAVMVKVKERGRMKE